MKKTKKIGFILIVTSTVMELLLGLFFHQSLQEDFIQKKVQHAVKRMDDEMRTLITKGLNHDELEKTETGLTVFMSDTLVFWNRNDVNPKLMKRKVTLNHDTICQLQSGNYYVKSYQSGTMSYYVYKLINTNYPIENRYFENVDKTLPTYIKATIQFEEQQGIPLINNDETTIAKYQIIGKPQLRKPFKFLWWQPLLILLLIGIGMACRKPIETIPEETKNPNKRTTTIEIGGVLIIILSIVGTYIYYRVGVKQENDQMRQQAELLLEKRDEAFETSYAQFAEQIKVDTSIREMIFAESNILAEVILGYSKELLFDETMQNYNATLTLCAPTDEIAIQPEGYVTDCDNYFLEKIANNKQKRVGDGLYLMDYYTLDPNYLGKIKIDSKDTLQQKTLYFEFYKPIAPEGFGFPQLLQETYKNTPHDYSVGSYRDNQLVYKYGRYVYPNFMNRMKLEDKNFVYSKKYKHYTIFNGDNNALVISTPTKGWSQITAPFAVFFLGMLLPFLLIMWLIKSKTPNDKKEHSFRKRLQTIVFLTLGIALVVIGPVSVIYMQTLYNQKTQTAQFETTLTLANEMRNDIDFRQMLRTASRDTWNETLQQYSTSFYTDLNLYHLNGQLLATTRPEIYELNLQGPVMNAEAYQNIHRNKELYYTHAEYLGKGKYESGYIPLPDSP